MIIVTSNADSGAGTLRDAIAAAVPGELITFSISGTITLTTGELAINQALTITGPGSANLTIDGNGASRIFNLTGGILVITGLTLTNGDDVNGGALHNETTLTLIDIIVTGSHASGDGGGIHNTSTIVGSEINVSTCSADGAGGGIYNSGTFTTLDTSVSTCTSATDGAGIWNSGTLSHAGGVTDGNTATQFGGGVWNSGTYTPTEVTFSSNVSVGNGAGIHNDIGGTVDIVRCTLSGNDPIGFYNNQGTLTIDNSTVSGNTGTGIVNAGGTIGVTHSTIIQNQYGIVNDPGSVASMQNTILAGNTGVSPADLETDTADFTSNGNNIFGFTSNPVTPGTGDQFGLNFAALIIGPLQNNSGPTFTHALLTGSPALDAGNNTGAPATDQRGLPRIFNSTIDIGAYESQTGPPCGTLVVTTPLPGWLTQQGDCLVVTPGAFRAPTKAEATAAVQAALDAFVTAAQASGDITCDCPTPPSECAPASATDIIPVTAGGSSASMAYCSSNNTVWLADNTTNQITVIDPRTNVRHVFVLPDGNAIKGMVYSPVQDRLYVSYSPHAFADPQRIQVCLPNRTLGTVYDTAFPGQSGSKMAYDEVNDRFIIVDTSVSAVTLNIEIVDCATLTQLALLNPTSKAFYPAYSHVNNSYYITTHQAGGKVWKIDASTFAITLSTYTARTQSFVGSIPEKPILALRNPGGSTVFLDPATDTELITYGGYNLINAMVYNPCLNEIQLAIGSVSILCVDGDTYAINRQITNAGINSWNCLAYSEFVNRTYAFEGNEVSVYVFS